MPGASCCCCACPEQGSVYVIEQCGKYDRIVQPGCNLLNCICGEAVAGALSMRVQQIDVHCETKTRDNVFVGIVVSVQYAVVPDKLYDAYYKLTDSSAQIKSYVFDSVRSSVPKMALDDVFTSKDEIADAVKNELSKAMDSFGFSIVQTLVTDITPAATVRDAMNAINAAQRLRMAAVEKAEAEKIQVVKAAEAEAEAKYLQGTGIARQRQAIVNGLRESVTAFSEKIKEISSKDVMDLMLTTQYFDTLRDIGIHSRSNTLFIPHSPAAVGDIASQVRSGLMQAQYAAPGVHQTMTAAGSTGTAQR